MARPPSFANRVADALVTALGAISVTADPNRWLTDPKTVKRGLLVSDWTNAPKPVLAVQVSDWRSEPLMAERHEVTLTLSVHMFSHAADGALAERALNDLAADVVSALLADDTLGGLVQSAYEQGYSSQEEAMERTGLAVGTVTITAVGYYDHQLVLTPP